MKDSAEAVAKALRREDPPLVSPTDYEQTPRLDERRVDQLGQLLRRVRCVAPHRDGVVETFEQGVLECGLAGGAIPGIAPRSVEAELEWTASDESLDVRDVGSGGPVEHDDHGVDPLVDDLGDSFDRSRDCVFVRAVEEKQREAGRGAAKLATSHPDRLCDLLIDVRISLELGQCDLRFLWPGRASRCHIAASLQEGELAVNGASRRGAWVLWTDPCCTIIGCGCNARSCSSSL